MAYARSKYHIGQIFFLKIMTATLHTFLHCNSLKNILYYRSFPCQYRQKAGIARYWQKAEKRVHADKNQLHQWRVTRTALHTG